MKQQTKLMLGDNMESLKKLPDNSIDSIVTDPPYALTSIKKRFGKEGSAPAQFGTDGAFQRASKGFMGKEWDAEVPTVEFWREVYRVLKPGGHILSFGGTRTYHRMVVNIEDAGFEIRDQVMWLYGSGFPKSHNIGKAVDKIEGNEREVVGERSGAMNNSDTSEAASFVKDGVGFKTHFIETKGQSKYEGWGTALKPANEPICVARKPLSEKTIADNVIKWGTGGINIDGCRVATDDKLDYSNMKRTPNEIYGNGKGCNSKVNPASEEGRFPANIILDEEAAELLDLQSEGSSRYFLNIPEEKTYKKKNDICLNNNNCVLCVENTGWNMPQITELSVPTNVAGLPSNKLVHYVKSVLNLCEKQATYIVANLVAMETENMELQHIQDFTQDYKSYILIQNLVKSVEQMENIDTTQITQSLLKLFGSALRAIEKNINQDTKEKAEQKSEQYRFLYQAKVSKKERNLGLDGFEEKETSSIGSTYAGNQTTSKIGGNPDKATEPKKNNHPTLKPINLMTYLCRLITPEGGIVLDPFMGSGSTGIAARLEGFRFLGMEMDKDYFKIAEARIEAYEEYRKLLK